MKRIQASQYAPEDTPKSIRPCRSLRSFSAMISVLKFRKLTITGMKNQKDPCDEDVSKSTSIRLCTFG